MRLILAALLSLSALPAFAPPALAHDGVHVNAAYAVVASDQATTASVYMSILNHAAEEDRLVFAATPAASGVTLHHTVEDASGMVVMEDMPEGFVIPAEGAFALTRGADHIMLTGLTQPLVPGDRIALQLTFARGDVIDLVVPVQDATALPDAGAVHNH